METRESEHGDPQNQISPKGFRLVFFRRFPSQKISGVGSIATIFRDLPSPPKKNLCPKAGKGSPMPDEVPIGGGRRFHEELAWGII